MKIISKILRRIGTDSGSDLRDFLNFFRANNPILSKTGTIIKKYIFDCFYGDKTKLNFVKELSKVRVFEWTEYSEIANFLAKIDESIFSLEEIVKSLAFSSGQLYPNKVKAEKYLILKDSLEVFKLLEKLDIDYQSYLWDISNVIASGSFANISCLEKFLENYFPLDVEFNWEYIKLPDFDTGYSLTFKNLDKNFSLILEKIQEIQKDFIRKIGEQKYDLACLGINKVEVSNHDGFYNSFINLSFDSNLWIIEIWRQNYEKIIKRLNELKQTNLKIDLDINYSECVQKNTDNVLKILDWISKEYDSILSENIKEIYITNHWNIKNYDNGKKYIAIDVSLDEIEVKKYDKNLNSYKDYERTGKLRDLLDKVKFLKN